MTAFAGAALPDGGDLAYPGTVELPGHATPAPAPRAPPGRPRVLSSERILRELPRLVAFVRDALEERSHLGDLVPVADRIAEDYWRVVAKEVRDGRRVVLAVADGDSYAGMVQIALPSPPADPYRAELQRLRVHSSHHSRGIGAALLLAAETEARRRGRPVLYLDAPVGAPIERLCVRLGWARAGVVPDYSLRTDATSGPLAIYYRIIH